LLGAGDLNIADVDSSDRVAVANEIPCDRYATATTEIQDVAWNSELAV
jgi:hypothetical protein